MKRGKKYPKTNTGAANKKGKVGDIPAGNGPELVAETDNGVEPRAKREFPVIDDEDIQEFPLPKAFTPEGRENQLISFAYDLVEKRLREGTATAQETVHFLKMGSTKSRLEKEKGC